MRLHSYIARCGVASRRKAEKLIEEGRVTVNGKRITVMGFDVNDEDIVQVDTETIEIPDKKYYIALNKPRGYVCTNYDPKETKYARDLIDIKDKNLLFSVGRLDKDSNGLLLFTNDGDFANKMAHPKFEIEKEYLVRLDKNINIDDLNKALDGLYIDSARKYIIKRYDLVPRTKQYVKVTLTEGRKREVRVIFSFLGYKVKALTRIRIGTLELGSLMPGEWRNLKKEEVFSLLFDKAEKKGKRRINDSRN